MSAPASTPAAPKRTPLYNLHRELGAKLIDFGGWEMPGQYTGILEEHKAVSERVGIFDVSHIGGFGATGRGAAAYLQGMPPNDVGKLDDWRAHYSAFLTEKGTFVDDLLVYRRGADSYMLVVNAGNTPKDFAWASSRTGGGVAVTDTTYEIALLSVQGPRAGARGDSRAAGRGAGLA